MIFKRLFARKTNAVQALYEAIVAAARQPVFYADWKVPDTVDGRFEMIVLHLHLAMERLRGQGAEAEVMRQKLVDGFFLDMDRSLREMGVGDLSVGKKVRKMSEAFYGRALAYTKAGDNEAQLIDAVKRNVFPDDLAMQPIKLAQWVKASRAILEKQSIADILLAKISYAGTGDF